MTNDTLSNFIELATKEYYNKTKNYVLLYNLLVRCRKSGYYYFGYFCGKLLQPVNNYKYLDELAICAYYIGKYQESLQLCNYILKSNCLSENDKNRIIKNKKFCEQKLKIGDKNE